MLFWTLLSDLIVGQVTIPILIKDLLQPLVLL